MRKSFMLGVLLVVLTSVLFGLSFPELNHVSSDYDQIVLEFNGDMFTKGAIQTPEGTFVRLSFPGSTESDIIGAPELPVIRELVEIPLGAEPEVRLEIAEYYEVELPFLIYPRQPSRVKLPVEHPFVFDQQAYENDDWLFGSHCKIEEVGLARDSRLAILEVRPYDYNPVSGKLRVMKAARVIIDLPGSDELGTELNKDRYQTIYSRTVNRSAVINPGAYDLFVPPTDIGFLIIGASGTVGYFDDYVHWKSRKGFKVEAYDLSTVGSTASDIEDFIEDKYNTGTVPPQFVLLVGDEDYLPCQSGANSSGAPTDLYYADIDEASSYNVPDLYIGRWSVSSSAQITELINRCIDYEHFDYSDDAWTNKVCLPSTDDPTYHGLAEATQAYVNETWLTPMGFTQVDIIQAYYSGTGTQVINAINNGRMIVNYTGHGATTFWDAPRVTQTNVRNMTNTDMYPFVISNACVTGKFDVDECFAETWIRQTDKGALAFMGASNNTMWNEDDAFERRMYDSVFVADYCFIGGMHHKGLLSVLASYSSRANYYFDIYHVFGDPSIALWFQPPAAMSVSHSATKTPSAGSFTVSVTAGGSALEDALVCVTNDDDVHEAEYTTSLGEAAFSLPSMTTGDTLYVTVTAYNHITYEGYALVSGNGPYLIYSAHAKDDDNYSGTSGDGDGTVDSDELIGLNITLENSGTQIAYSVTGTISESSPYASITRATSSYGNIAVGGTAANTTQYLIQIADNVPDGEEITINLTATDSRDSSWTCQVVLTARAPVISANGYTFAGGDGDPYIEPGENITLDITAYNESVELGLSVIGTISESDAYVTITTPNASYGTVNPSATVNTSSPYQLSISSSCPTPRSVNIQITYDESRDYTFTDNVTLMIGNAGFFDDMEGSTSGYTVTNASNAPYRASSGDYAWYFGNTTTYNYAIETTYEVMTPAIVAPSSPYLTFSSYRETESDFDWVEIAVGSGGTWHVLDSLSGRNYGWRIYGYDLSSYFSAGESFYVRYRLYSDAGLVCEGWYIDDIEVTDQQVAYCGAQEVTPWAGNTDNEYVFSCEYISPSSETPSVARVYVDGTAHNMTLTAGTVSDAAEFTWSTSSLAAGGHQYYFEFISSGGTIRYPKSGYLNGPSVNAAPHITYNIGSTSSSFTHSGEVDNWEWGIPSSGPGSSGIPEGNRVWATELSGDYDDNANGRLMPPEFDLSGIEEAYFGYWHWYRFQAPNSYGYHDGGNVKISVDGGEQFIVYPQHGYDAEMSQYSNLNNYEPSYADDDIGTLWQFEVIDLSPWTGHSVQIYCDFSSSTMNVESGWYINNVYILSAISAGMDEPIIIRPEQLSMSVYPNPFNNAVSFEMQLSNSGYTKVEIFDINGRCVDKICEEYLNVGIHYLSWDGSGHRNGIYFAKVTSDNGIAREDKTIKLVYVK